MYQDCACFLIFHPLFNNWADNKVGQNRPAGRPATGWRGDDFSGESPNGDDPAARVLFAAAKWILFNPKSRGGWEPKIG